MTQALYTANLECTYVYVYINIYICIRGSLNNKVDFRFLMLNGLFVPEQC